MTDSMPGWAAWISKPLWVLAAAQVIPLLAFALPVARWTLWEEQRQITDIERQLAQHTLAVRHIRQELATMPALSVMQTQLAAWEAERRLFQDDMPARLVAAPLSQSGAVLLSLQPAPDPADRSVWLLTFRADYRGVLQVLRQFIALPHVLRIEQLTMKSAQEGLHIEMSLMKPPAERRDGVE
ncbi:hypothetical protein [Brenneria tiliae]|uniref:hypothetical protein n=1 Tax=Brenneria tiliae TaxID=2914984 RepID=UPI002014CB78|nr:hypothetical protein [Brenneria tiliae]MCL2897732.1 hypothetical protein [Brenneria tiliae]MCL2902329.1 hypothetical protein [Brenneria tiliae]